MPTVFDNLIARGDMPVTVGIFINPGCSRTARPNRSVEYDTLSDTYARFLLEEILPEVDKTVTLRTDAGRPRHRRRQQRRHLRLHGRVGAARRSSARSCRGSAASPTSPAAPRVRAGGHNYQALVRKTPKKPIRVFLQDGANDLDNVHGNWPLANLTLAGSLAYAGYDYRFEYGKGFHSHRHGRAIFPDTLRWLWRDWHETGSHALTCSGRTCPAVTEAAETVATESDGYSCECAALPAGRWIEMAAAAVALSMRRCGKYSFQRRDTSAAVSGSHSTSFGNHGFMRASMRIGGV